MVDRAVVHDNRDPQKRGRLRVRIPSKTGNSVTGWIWPVVTGGYLVIPSPGDQVWVPYESGGDDFPVWLGKIESTKSYSQSGTDLGDVSALIQRISDLEADVADLQEAVDTLASSKANVSHTHG